MLSLINISSALLPPAYCAAVAIYALAFFRRDSRFQRWTRPALILALTIHAVLIYAETVYFGHCLVYSPFELMTMFAFTIALTYLIVELSTGERGTGVFFLSLALLFQTMSNMFGTWNGVEAGSALLQDAVGLHISAAIFGYTAFAMSAVYGLLYLMLYHQIKSSRFGTLYERLPSLGLLEKMSAYAAMVGLVFLSVAILIAVTWLPDALPGFRYYDPKVIATMVVWVLYAVAIGMKYFARVGQRRFVLLSLVGFAGVFLSMTLVNLLLSDFHDFQ